MLNQQKQLPISLGAEMLYPYFSPKPNTPITVYARLNIKLGQAEGVGRGPIDIAYAIDITASTHGYIDVLREAVINSVELLPPGSNIAGVAFTATAHTFCSFGKLETAKTQFVQEVDRLMSGGGTVISSGIQGGYTELQRKENPIRVLIMFTDGGTIDGDERSCLALTQQVKNEGIIFVIIGLCDKNLPFPLSKDYFNPELLEQMAGSNYEYLEKPEAIGQVFQEKILGASQTGITSAKLLIQPVQWAQIQEGCLAMPTYMAADNPLEIQVGEIQVEKEVAALVKLSATLPDDVAAGKAKSFARVSLVGDVPSQGISQQELAKANVVLRFSDDPKLTDAPNTKVVELVRIVAAAKDLDAAAKAGTPQEAQQKLESAKRKTQAFSNQEAAAALLAQISSIEKDVAAGDMQGAQRRAAATGRRTQAFSDKDAAEALKKMLGGN